MKKESDKKGREIEKLNKKVQQQKDAIHVHKSHISKLQQEQEASATHAKTLQLEISHLGSVNNQLHNQLSTVQSSLHQNLLTYESQVAQYNYTQLIQRKQIEVLYEELTAVDPNQVYAVNTRLGQVIDTYNRSVDRPSDLLLFCPSPQLTEFLQANLKPEIIWREYQSNEVMHHAINMGILGSVAFSTLLVLGLLFCCRSPRASRTHVGRSARKAPYVHAAPTASAASSGKLATSTDSGTQTAVPVTSAVSDALAVDNNSSVNGTRSIGNSSITKDRDDTHTESSIYTDTDDRGINVSSAIKSTGLPYAQSYSSSNEIDSGTVTPKAGLSASASVSRAVTPLAGGRSAGDRPDSRAATPPSHKSSSGRVVPLPLPLPLSTSAVAPVVRDDDAPTPVAGRTKNILVEEDAPTPVAGRFKSTALEDAPTPVLSKMKSSGLEDLPTPVTSKLKPPGLTLEDLPTPDTSKVRTARIIDGIATGDSGVNTPVIHRQYSKSVIGPGSNAVDDNEVTPRVAGLVKSSLGEDDVTPRTTSFVPGIREEELDGLRRSIDEQFRQVGNVHSHQSHRTNSFATNKSSNSNNTTGSNQHKDAESQSVTPRLIRSPSRAARHQADVGTGTDSGTSSGSVTPRVVTGHSRSVSRERSAVRDQVDSESRDVTPRFVRSDSHQLSPHLRNAPADFEDAVDRGSRSVTPRLIKTHSSSRLVTSDGINSRRSTPTTGPLRGSNRHSLDVPPATESLSRSVTPRVVRTSSRSHTPAATKVSSHSRGSSGGSVYSQLVDYDYDLPTSRSVTPRLQKSPALLQSRSGDNSRSETPVKSTAYMSATQYSHSGAGTATAEPKSESSSRAATPVLTRGASVRATDPLASSGSVSTSSPISPAPSQPMSNNTPSAHVKAMISSEQTAKSNKKKKKGKGK